MSSKSIYHRYKLWEQRRRYRQWAGRGKPLPPPHFVKQLAIKELVKEHSPRVLVETGTYKGDMVRAMAGLFDKIYSIEVDENLWRSARQKFHAKPHIRLMLGDSSTELPKVLAEVQEPAVFWLDGHYTGGHAGKAVLNTPILSEEETIARHSIKQHLILIDDARLFTGKDDYPTLDSLRELSARLFPTHQFSVVDDIIRILPASKKSK